ncbi:hypothetical protein KAK06_13520 [Ideonella sp. 4Y11]|uniref:Sulfotransferase domain-containing protein n=1 Tax=Ideonella aquatica TaxID=2824119 RepID=A0A941BJY8_9BURK|nr:hypothetical protein [Ideonella aquatica]MBQ0959967.1 hypothetical protein [Ideonella aquatica]
MTSTPRKTLFIHGGMQKTGSTSIQVTLSETPTTPLYQFLYRENGNSGYYLRSMFDASFTGNLNEKGKGRVAGLHNFGDRVEKFLDRPKSVFVISSEMIGSAFGTASLTMMRDWFAKKVDDMRVVLYVREPYGYIESLFQEQLKKRSVEFVNLARMSPPYKAWFTEVEDVFGAENVIYRHFSSAKLRNGDVVSDFIATTGLDLPESSIVRKNEGLSRRGVAVIANFNHQLASRTHSRDLQATRWITRLASQLPGPKLRLSNELLVEAVKGTAEDIAWMESRLGCPLGHLNRKPAPDGLTDLRQVLDLDEETRRWAVDVLGVSAQSSDIAATMTEKLQLAAQAEDASILRQTRRHFAVDDPDKAARREERAAARKA